MRTLAAEIVETLTGRGETIAVAESLTGGLLVAELITVPGASLVVRGGVVAYATDLKARLLGVDDALLARVGAVHAEVATQMARGVRLRLAVDVSAELQPAVELPVVGEEEPRAVGRGR